MLHKQSLSRLSHVRKIVHDITPQSFHTVNLTRNAETREKDSKNCQLSIQHSNLSINRRLNTSKRLLLRFGESRNALYSSTSENTSLSKEGIFFSSPVQMLLTRLTGMDYDRIFRVAKLGQHISAPEYQFLTDAELKKAQQQAIKTAKKLIQMPPVMSERKKGTEVLDHDSAIEGYDSAKLVFTDITFGVHDRERFIVVREPDGILRHAKGEERDRLNQIYFPHLGRKAYVPAMFKKENLDEILREDRYQYILDRNCEQFEPDNPEYIATAETVYDHINLNKSYDVLWSTRHFGPMVFYYVWEKKCDDMIAWYLTKRNEKVLPKVLDVIMLYYHIHSESKFTERSTELAKNIQSTGDEDYKISESDQLALIRNYIEYGSDKSMKIHSALNSYLEARDRIAESNQFANSN